MNNIPCISVCMPFYNVEKYIEEAIESVLNQSFLDFELIMVNDGSTDDSLNVVQRFTDERIRIIDSNHDYIKSLNIGLEQAKGKYIARMDADDRMFTDRLLTQYNYLEYNEDIAACGAGYEQFGDKKDRYLPSYLEPEDIEVRFSDCNCFTIGMIRKQFLDDHRIRYRPEFIYAEDYRLWADIIIAGGKLVNLPQVLYYYRIHKKQISVVNGSLMMKNSNLIQRDINKYLFDRDVEKYGKLKPVHDQLYDLSAGNDLSIRDYCVIANRLLMSRQ